MVREEENSQSVKQVGRHLLSLTDSPVWPHPLDETLGLEDGRGLRQQRESRMRKPTWMDGRGEWFEVFVMSNAGSAHGAQQLVQAACAEGYRARLGKDEEGREVALLFVCSESPTSEVHHLVTKCGLSGYYRPLAIYSFSPC
jgi:hypothetical protein